jgi:hypothetical protein
MISVHRFAPRKNSHWKTRLDGVIGSYMLTKGIMRAHQIQSRQTSAIVKVQSPMAKQSKSRSDANRCGKIAFSRRFLSIIVILSRRCVRRRNAIAARAFIAVDCVGAASLLP